MLVYQLKNKLSKTALMLALGASLAACQTSGLPFANNIQQQYDAITYRDNRVQQTINVQSWKDCTKQGLDMAQTAADTQNPGQYVRSAEILQTCASNLNEKNAHHLKNDRMRYAALSVVNYFKGGDIAMARQAFNQYKTDFADNDLYFSNDKSSFASTMEVLLATAPNSHVGRFSITNINDDLKSEFRRVNYWSSN